ncbi:MAG: hypothetical protein QXT86_14315 [Archaeoglobaceae archaeon]
MIMLMEYWKLKTKIVIILVIVYIFVVIFFSTLYLKVSNFQSITQFGLIKVGDPLPSFIGISQSGKRVGPTFLKDGKFYVYVIDEQLPPCCLDLECGEQAKIVINKGGHLIGISDFKYANILGVRLVRTPTLIRKVVKKAIHYFEEKLRWQIPIYRRRFETSLIIITDDKGYIMYIYKNAKIRDIPHIMKDLNL